MIPHGINNIRSIQKPWRLATAILGTAGAAGGLGLGIVSPEAVKSILSDAMEYQVTSFTIAFILAWKIVKRDMKKDNEGLVGAVNGVKAELHTLNEANTKRFGEYDDQLEQLKIQIAELKQARA